MRYATAVPASVCLPAYNEARTIAATLAELSRLPASDVDEIVVCLNGCTDGTADVVAESARREPRIAVIASELGKNRAWNALVAAARNHRLVFTDADVRPSPQAIAALLAALERAPVAIAAAFERPHGTATRWGGMVELMSTTLGQDYISGRLYAIDRDRLASVMASRGLIAAGERPRLPTDLVTEDSWLTAVVADDALAVVPDAPIHYGVEGLADVIRVLARNGAARDQLRSEYPALYRADRNRLLSARTAAQILGRRLTRTAGPAAAARGLAGMALRAAVRRMFAGAIGRHKQRILADVRAGRGALVMATSGRLPSKGG
jgi:glycosyltransferase involved in cell wall biosynthesis